MLVFGILISAAWLLGLSVIVYLKFDEFIDLDLNALGDFLAGGFAPLAFLWLVIGYFQQGKELSLTREALILQANELSNSVEQQRELVKAARDEIEQNKAHMSREYIKEKLKAQPVLVLTDSQAGELDGEWVVRLHVNNRGHSVSRINVSLVNNNADVRLKSSDFIDRWDFDSIVVIDISRPRGRATKSSDFFEMHLFYIDGMSEDSSEVLYFTSSNDRYQFSTEIPESSAQEFLVMK